MIARTSDFSLTENLIHPTQKVEIPHPEVGRHFCEFNGNYYIPNNEKMEEFPEDLEFTQQVCLSM